MTDLRDYQARAIDQIEAATKALYVLPTGGGKTVVATGVIERAVARGERVLMLTHRREILRQTSLKMPIEHGLIPGLNIDRISGAGREHSDFVGAVHAHRQIPIARGQSDHH